MPLLSLKDPTLDTGKNYTHTLSGWTISEPNQLFFTLHKKEIKLIPSKNLGATMEVFAYHQRPVLQELVWEEEVIRATCQHFLAFDEELGKRYAFLPYFPTKQLPLLNQQLHQLGIDLSFSPSPKGVITQDLSSAQMPEHLSLAGELTHLYTLTLLYGKFLLKGEQLQGIKIQIPLFGRYFFLQELLEQRIHSLQTQGIYLLSSLNRQGNKATLQITSSDRELLQLFAHWSRPFLTCSAEWKKNQITSALELLLSFLANQALPQQEEIKKLIAKSTIKLLTKE